MTNNQIPKSYQFRSTEEQIYQFWEKSGYFQPWNDPNKPDFDPTVKPFVISIPPPNVTGELHLGHAMFVSMEDLMIRYHRMKGEPTLWVPGSDHAGIATQLQVEKALAAEGLTREQIGREEFLRRTWAWKEKYGNIIYHQIRRLGASCDWTRTRFTLDEGLSRAVREAFVRLYEKGLIYRGLRLINWAPGLKTAVSDLEVEYSQEMGTLYYFKYMLVPEADSQADEYIPVATTRPETILGDTAVAVHPEDERYRHFIGRKAIVPILGRQIPVIADTYVDREFGTGALKITPGHDQNDYEIGLRHGLEVISVLDESARINENGGPYAGQDRFEARKNIWKDMQAQGLTIKEEPYMMNIPRSQRGNEIIEPMISTQWFVKIQPLAEAALKAVQEGRIRIIPERFTKIYTNWLENIEDWCISRQLWWGHRIPVWYCADCGELTVSRTDPTECQHCHSARIEQDPDVLDTWFSSALWPFSTLGWPEETPDYRYFYPTSVMETGYDILFFWVARMIMTGLEFTGKEPFHTVYLHGLIRDEHGRKMSKTLGNIIDPLTVMEDYGTDALRFTLLVGSTPGNDMNLSVKKVEANRNFANKVWNIGRFIIQSLDQVPNAPSSPPQWTLADSWIWARLQTLIRDVERLFQNYQFGEAGRLIYDFLWSEFADWYIEIAKLQLRQGGDRAFYTAQTLVKVFDQCLRLLHPFTPFVTEAVWGYLKEAAIKCSLQLAPKQGWEEALIIARWPQPRMPEGWEEEKVAQFSLIQEVIREIRNARSEKGVALSQSIAATFITKEHLALLQDQIENIQKLANLDPQRILLLERFSEKPTQKIPLVIKEIEVYLDLEATIDLQREQQRLRAELEEVNQQIQRLRQLLDSPFSQKAPAPIVEKERQKLADFEIAAEKLKKQLLDLGVEA
ncbi:MAG: valine--tRNA ligase [Anaerolineae bacterium]|jgi:valyl-tRNA synthetase|nr:MAG: valine--tRNA ligase [Anaerolineae bacterium]